MSVARIALFAGAGLLGCALVLLLTGQTESPPAAMRARFDSTTNYAAFIEDVMQRSTEGGLFYAELAFQRCQAITAMQARPDADSRDYLADGLDSAALALYHRTRKKLVQIGRGAAH